MAETLTPDICIIGAGSAGLTAAAAAAAFGVEVVLVERGAMGGDCLNHGCVPSKALIAAAHHAHAIAEAGAFGIHAGVPQIDFAAVMAHVRSVIETIAPNDSVERFEGLGVRVLRESARFVDERTVQAGSYAIRARRFILASGSRPAMPPVPGLDQVPVLTNETLFEQTSRPGHLLVLGAGPIGLEMAQAHRRLGAEVTVLDAARALGRDDRELVAVVLARLRAEGVTVHEEIAVNRAERAGEGIRLTFTSDGQEMSVTGDRLLVAIGRRANIEDLGLDAAGIVRDEKGIVLEPGLRTSNRRVYAIGDVAGHQQFTHVAGYQAGLAIQQILFRLPAREKPDLVPRVTYTDPELAEVGLGEEAARERHGTVHILRSPFADNDRAQTERRTEGSIKLVTTKRGRLVGVGIVGAGAGEMINLYALALTKKLSVADLRGLIAAYPTRGEAGKRAALSYYDGMTRKPAVRALVRFLRGFG
ncbi:dihydrolipoyl dehydrogenase family protein [Pararhizobium mangrovi]|uniref:Dihydrolipoamide dehydrogenase n=1 Tax=Pararhizobium mangrovi TaxID=2590452 RepID=A0A506U3J6_9HYPH|nr:FAD-dependent oxidoreductase [Pararhizobium mangrovi]TPW28963.1 dihydrolipoamide dehydrogenase [Pararhizobium mangrovi]